MNNDQLSRLLSDLFNPNIAIIEEEIPQPDPIPQPSSGGTLGFRLTLLMQDGLAIEVEDHLDPRVFGPMTIEQMTDGLMGVIHNLGIDVLRKFFSVK